MTLNDIGNCAIDRRLLEWVCKIDDEVQILVGEKWWKEGKFVKTGEMAHKIKMQLKENLLILYYIDKKTRDSDYSSLAFHLNNNN